MEVGEVLEVYEGPVMDDSVQVFRVRGCALKDGACGWVTIAGNQGVVGWRGSRTIGKLLKADFLPNFGHCPSWSPILTKEKFAYFCALLDS